MKRKMYRYHWGNNSERAKHKDKPCKILASGKMNTVLIEFENGFRMTTSKRALRRVPYEQS